MNSDSSTSAASERSLDSWPVRGRWFAWWLRPTVAIPLFLGLLVLVSPVLIRGYRLSQVPYVAAPFDTQAALDLVVSDEQNAYVEYRQAVALLVELSSTENEKLDDALGVDTWADVPESIRNWVEMNQPAIERWKLGCGKPDSQSISPRQLRYDERVPLFLEMRTLARLVRLNAMRLRAEGHADLAWELLRLGLKFSHHIGRRGTFPERLLGVGIDAVVSHELVKWAQDPRVTAELLSRVGKELDEEFRRSPPVSLTFQSEYLAACGTIRSSKLTEKLDDLGVELPIPGLGRLCLYALGEPELCDRCLSHAFGNYLNQVDKPRRERTKQLGTYSYFALDPGVTAVRPTPSQLEKWTNQSVICRAILGEIKPYMDVCDRLTARNLVLKTVLKLEIYRRQHGDYPDALAQLVPDFMSEIPDDIFEASPTPLKYRRDGDQALIWSVSANGVDDAGSIENGIDLGYLLGPKRPMPSTDSSGDPAQMPE